MRLRNSGLMACLFVFLFSFPAHALVTTWDYTVSSVFTDTVFVPGRDDSNGILNGDYTTSDTALTWGVPAYGSQSGLSIDPSTINSTVDTYVGSGIPTSSYIASSISLVHDNYPIYSNSDRLSTTTLSTTVLLDPLNPDNVALDNKYFTFDLKFVETSNSGSHPNDIFALLGGFPNFNFTYDDGTDTLKYFVNVFPTDGNVLTPLTLEEAGIMGVQVGTAGFSTPENATTILPFGFTITTSPLNNPVPEPATFLLLGGGLVGLAFYRRKK